MALASPRATVPRGFDPLPENIDAGWLQIQLKINQILRGRLNVAGTVTVGNGNTSATITDARLGVTSVILLQPEDANAAALNWYISALSQGSATVTVTAAPGADAAFRYVILG